MTDQSDNLQVFGINCGVIDSNAVQQSNPASKPLILLPGGNTKILDTAKALFATVANSGKWFFRGGQVVVVKREKGGQQSVLEIMKSVKARSEFELYADFRKWTPKGNKPDILSDETAKAILGCSAAKDILPNLKGLINCPIMVLRDHALHITSSGYDEFTEYFVTGKPLKEPANVEEAVSLILGMLKDFDFQSEGDRSRAIASIITPMLKTGGLITSAVPVEIIEANDSQTGKGYFALLRCAVYGELPLYVAARKGGVGSFDESFASALVKGRPFVLLDNMRGKLDSVYIESFTTAQGHFPVRLPFAGEVYVDPSTNFLTVTSNGMETTEDFANRAIFIRLKKQYRKVFKKLLGKDMLTVVRSSQPILLGAVAKIIQYWFEKGMPRTGENGHTFSDWAQVNDWIVQNIFHCAPLLEGHDEARKRLADPNLTFLRMLAVEIEKRHELEFPFTATTLFELCDEASIDIPGLRSNDRLYGIQQIGRIMNKLFADREVRELDGYTITRTSETVVNQAGNAQASKQYNFAREPAQGT